MNDLIAAGGFRSGRLGNLRLKYVQQILFLVLAAGCCGRRRFSIKNRASPVRNRPQKLASVIRKYTVCWLELEEAATCREFRQVRTEGARAVARNMAFYNLDMVLSVG